VTFGGFERPGEGEGAAEWTGGGESGGPRPPRPKTEAPAGTQLLAFSKLRPAVAVADPSNLGSAGRRVNARDAVPESSAGWVEDADRGAVFLPFHAGGWSFSVDDDDTGGRARERLPGTGAG